MVTGLLALLDDVIAISKLAAASLDDIAAQTVKTTGTAAGVVIDDAAVTPRYVVSFAAERELPIIGRIAWGSLKNKILVLLPAAVFFSAFASWAITPLLMIGGVFLCFEGYEKVHQLIVPHAAHTTARHAGSYTGDPKAAEEKTVAGAIRTDFILSAEIMAISIATILSPSLVMQVAVLFAVAIFVTAGVYGLVAIIVKADDFGIFLAQRDKASMRALGRGIVRAVPPFLKILSFVGTFAMLWVGGGIIVHGLQAFDIKGPERVVHALKESVSALTSFAVDVLGWFVGASAAAIFGMAIGAITAVMLAGLKPVWRKLRPA